MPQKSKAQEWDPKQGTAVPTPPDSKEDRKMSNDEEDFEDDDFDDSEETDEDVDEVDDE